MSESRERMISALREVVLPVVRDMAFRGSFPHFRRTRDTQIDLLTFQFSSWGGSFVVEVAYCEPAGFTNYSGVHTPPDKVRVRHIHPTQRLRLGSHPPDKVDHWFRFEPESDCIYADTALEVLPWLRGQAEQFFREHRPSMARRT
jgi:hypothetical protein